MAVTEFPTTSTNPYLVGNYAPVTDETTAETLEVTGQVPEGLDGLLLRNGPNPFGPVDPSHHWFLGDGMVHGVRFSGGRAEWYRNRWVRTDALEANGGPAAADLSPARRGMPGKGGVNVVSHAGRILALGEVGLPWLLDDELETVGEYDFAGGLGTSMTAHPKMDPATGEMIFFGYDFGPVNLRYHVADATGALVHSVEIETKGPTMMHDVGVTATRTIFMDLPVVFDLDVIAEGRQMPFRWSDTYGARLGVLPRLGTSADVTWIDIDPCFVFHPLNAYDHPDDVAAGLDARIVMDVVRYPKMFATNLVGPHEPTLGSLVRWTIDPRNSSVDTTVLDDRPQEFPRVDPRVETREHRVGYSVALRGTGGFDSGDILRRDLRTGEVTAHSMGGHRFPSEAVFVPRGADAAIDDGWLLATVYDDSTGRSEAIVLDAQDLAADPVATVHLPVRVPFGFHGNWVAAPS